MGRSTTAQLISRAKNINEYNNNAVANDAIWVDYFNTALEDMVNDLSLEDIYTINYDSNVATEYDLPDDFYGVIDVYRKYGSYSQNVYRRRAYNSTREGYWTMFKGDKSVIDFTHTGTETFDVYYMKYPARLDVSQKDTQKPEVYTVAEMALVYKAVEMALRNNNQIGQAQEALKQYNEAIKKAKTAYSKARGF